MPIFWELNTRPQANLSNSGLRSPRIWPAFGMRWEAHRPAAKAEPIVQSEKSIYINEIEANPIGMVPNGNVPVTPNFFLSPHSNEYAACALANGESLKPASAAGSKSGGRRARRQSGAERMKGC